jgi:hypothetical protein
VADLESAAELLEKGWQQQPDHGPRAHRELLAEALEVGRLLGMAEAGALTERELDWSLHGRPNFGTDSRAF